MKRIIRLVVEGLVVGLVMSFTIVGGYVLGVGYAIEHVGHSCRLRPHVVTDLRNGFAWIGLAVAGVLMLAIMVESWKHGGVIDREPPEWANAFLVLMLWFLIANSLIFLLAAIWVGCGIWGLIQ